LTPRSTLRVTGFNNHGSTLQKNPEAAFYDEMMSKTKDTLLDSTHFPESPKQVKKRIANIPNDLNFLKKLMQHKLD